MKYHSAHTHVSAASLQAYKAHSATLINSFPVVVRLVMSFWDSATPSAVNG
jgi:hypothetical protein